MAALAGLTSAIGPVVMGGVLLKFSEAAFSPKRSYMGGGYEEDEDDYPRRRRRTTRRSTRSSPRRYTNRAPMGHLPGIDTLPGRYSNLGIGL